MNNKNTVTILLIATIIVTIIGGTFTGDYSTNMTFCTLATCGGHALYETANWYGDDADFVS